MMWIELSDCLRRIGIAIHGAVNGLLVNLPDVQRMRGESIDCLSLTHLVITGIEWQSRSSFHAAEWSSSDIVHHPMNIE
jgi:hypothetical protein